MIKVAVSRLEQGGLILYGGTIKAGDLLEVYDVDRWVSQELENGYQREEYRERSQEIARFVRDCTIPILPAILASLRQGAQFQEVEDSLGFLEISRQEKAIWVIDGQHRVGAFKVLKERLDELEEGSLLSEEEYSECEKLRALLAFPLAVLFLDVQTSLARVKERITDATARERITGRDLERAFFVLVNETARRLRPSLSDRDAYRLIKVGFEGIPWLEKRGKWRADATELVYALNAQNMPLGNLINITGARGLGRPVQLASFVSSLERLFENERFKQLAQPLRLDFLRRYWQGIRDRIPEAFSQDRQRRHQYILLKTISVYALNRLANDIFNWSQKQDVMDTCLDILAKYDWSRASSPLRAFGGVAGVREAHRILLWYLYHNGPENIKEQTRLTLMNYGWWEERA